MDGVRENEFGFWEVFVGDEMVGRLKTNREAWREYDRKTGELTSKAEATSDWLFRKSADA